MTHHSSLGPRVLILMSDTGGGHRAVSEAVGAAITRAEPAARVDVVDLFAHGQAGWADRLTRAYSPVIRCCPGLYGAAFHLTNRPSVFRVVAGLAMPRLRAKAEELIRRCEPDAIVVAHPLLNQAAVAARAACGRRLPIVATITEFVTVHRSWVEPGVDLYSVPSEMAAARAVQFGADPSRVRLTGLPVGARFAEALPPPTAVRRRLGLDPSRPTFLCIGGGEGAGRLAEVVPALAKAGLDLQLIVICGRNRRLYERFTAARFPVPVSLHEFTQDVPELMAAADAIVTKGGPQTLGEALVVGRPVVITQLVPGQEEGNDRFVVENGVGFAAPTTRAVVESVRRLVVEPGLAERMAANARRLARPKAADEIATLLLAELPAPAR